jgi:PhoPQ-activated pathogenicity-related protein
MIFKAFLLLALLAVVKIGATPLDDYVNAPDAYFSYKLLKTYEKVGFKLYVLNVTSQKWMNESWVQNPVWWHFVSITVPDKLTRPDAAMLVIDGGGMGDE